MTLEHEGAAAPSPRTAAAYLDAEPRERNEPDAVDSTPFADILDFARRLVELGLFLFPTRPDRKAPAVTEWQQKSTRDLATIEGWVRRGWNLGIDTEKSGVVGFDEDAAGHLDVWEERCEVAPGRTFTARSQSGGRHELYRPPGGRLFRSSNVRFKAAGLKIDVKARGGLLMAPGSEFPSGAYSIADDVPIAELPEEVAEAWLVPVEETSPVYIDGLGPRPTFIDTEEPREQPLPARAVAWLDAVLDGEEERLRAAQDLADGEEPRWRQLTLDVANRYVLVHNAAPDTFPLDALRERFLDAAPTDRDWTEANNEDRWLDAVADVGGWAKPIPEHVLDASGDFGDLGPDETAGEDRSSDALAAIRAKYPLRDLRVLLDPNRPGRPWVVEAFLPAAASTALIAEAGLGKSLFTLSLGVAVARGDESFAGLRIPKRRRVILIDWENTDIDYAERFESLGYTQETVGELDGWLFPLDLPDALAPLDTAEGGRELGMILDAYGIGPEDLVVLDSTQRMASGPEDKSDTWRAFYEHTAKHLKKRGATVLRLDNTGHAESGRARGSSGKRDDVDLVWVARRPKNGAPGDMDLFATKGRMRGEVPPYAIHREEVDGVLRWSTFQNVRPDLVGDAVRFLDEIGVPESAGIQRTWEAVKAAGRDKDFPRDSVVAKAQKRRKDRSRDLSADFVDLDEEALG